MAREKHVIIWPCDGGNKRITAQGKPDETFGGDYAAWAAAIGAVFASTPGDDGTSPVRINQIIQNGGVEDGSASKPLKGVAIVCTFTDEDGDSHKYRFPEPLAANMSDDSQGNTVLDSTPGGVLATQMSNLTGYTLTFVRGWLDRAFQQT